MFWFIISLFIANVQAARIKDIADIYGVRDNAVFGYGLVTGLKRTGDTIRNEHDDSNTCKAAYRAWV